jgi:hypothetical protein
MPELIIGAAAAGSLVLLLRLSESRGLAVGGWKWGVTVAGLLYLVFVLMVVVEFLREGTPKGAMVMGTVLGFPAVVWWVLLGRLVFRRKSAPAAESEGGTNG